jgi:hypothetical protein
MSSSSASVTALSAKSASAPVARSTAAWASSLPAAVRSFSLAPIS